ncbi:TRAP transporter small permease subunit [Amphritea sp. 1_MG-2023]|uniref:TRAP transporter small permease subunit n=1 Tax=Amphritea sp. 1_MG-2023 TaxID=3062670 RepID=UPI0026E32F05|nr:TRAP transporter small permease subunit [Amphritea sp. 1_MG-2023]MDO6565080.1 TRAP transporter small permease subunit [Amphritea sp. 1_MG-2023]
MILQRYLSIQDGISEFIGRAVSWMCLALILVLLYEVVARYFFNAPTNWAHELSTMLYGTFCILAGAYTHKHRGHVRSEVIYGLFPKKGRAVMDVITGLMGLAVFSVFFMVALEFAMDSWAILEVSSKSPWAPPLYPFKSVMPLAVALLMMQSLAHLTRDICILFNICIEENDVT